MEVRNKSVDPNSPDIIQIMITNLKKWFGRTETEKFFRTWKEFIDFKVDEEETVDDFLLRYDTIDSQLKSCDETLSQRTLACHLISKLNVDELQKQNVLTKVKFEDNQNVFEDVKSAIRLLKGSLVSDKVSKSTGNPKKMKKG